MVFKKLKMGIWFFCGFAMIMLFCSLPLKHLVENYVTVLISAGISLVAIPIYTYLRRRKNPFIFRQYRSVRFAETDMNSDKFKKSPLFDHFKAEAIAAAIYCSVGAFAFAYYFSQRDGAKNVALVSVISAVCAYGMIMLIDLIIWGRTVAFYERHRPRK